MKRKVFYVLFGFLMSVYIISCGSTSNNDSNSDKCFGSEIKKLNGKCTHIEVKASPNDASDDRMIKVYYSIVPSKDKNSKKEPIALLVGGPGQSGTISIDSYINFLPLFFRERDMIIMDYRGAGFSEPYPRCDNLISENVLKACMKELKDKNIKLGDYTTANIAYDFNKILEKEKIEKAVLLGYSYGTRVASTIARDYPNKVSAMILDGFFAIEANGISQDKESVLDKLNDLANKYDKEYPTAKLRDRLEALATKKDIFVSLKKLSDLAYVSDSVIKAKKEIDLLEQRDQSDKSRSIDPIFSYRAFSNLMGLSIIMHEEFYFMNKQPAFSFGFGENTVKSLQKFQTVPLDISTINKIKPYFTKVPDDKEMQALTTDIPTIIFTGGLDYQTTKYWALNAQKTLKNSMHFFFPAEGHVVTARNRNSHSLMQKFLDDDGFRDSNGNINGSDYKQIRP